MCSISSSLNFARGCFRGYDFNDEAAALRQRRGRRRLPTTTTTYYEEDKRSKQRREAGGRRLQATRDTTTGMLALSGETRRGEARCFNQHCYVGGARRSCRVAVVAGHFNQQRLVGVNTGMVLHSGGVEWRGAARCFNIAASARRWCRANASRETRR